MENTSSTKLNKAHKPILRTLFIISIVLLISIVGYGIYKIDSPQGFGIIERFNNENTNLDLERAVWGSATLSNDLISYWKMDETVGTTASDELGIYDAFTANTVWNASGLINGAIMSAATPRINTSYAPQGIDAITINLWIKEWTATIGAQIFCFKGAFDCTTPDSNGDIRMYPGAGNFAVDFYDGVSRKQASTPTGLVKDKWFMITFVINQTTITGYLNGTNGTPTTITGFNWQGTDMFELSGDSSYNTNVSFDEVAIWNRTLTQEEIIDLYNDGTGFTYPLGEASVTLNSPADNLAIASSEIIFNASTTISSATLVNASLWHNASGTFKLNDTNLITEVSNESIFNKTFAEGTYLWNVQACDSDGDCGFALANRTFSVDTIAPSITINSPSVIEDFGSLTTNQTLNWTLGDTNFDSAWYNYNGTNITVYGSSNQTNIILETGDTNLTFWSNDSLGNINSTFIEWSYYILESASTYPTSAYETTKELLRLQVEAQSGLQSISANLWYNGTKYSSTVTNPSGDIYNATNNLEIPVVTGSSTRTFFWSYDITLANGTALNINTSSKSQTVDRTWLTYCNATYSVPYINFTTYNAENPFPELNATFKITIDWYLNTSTGNIRRNMSWEDITEGNYTWGFCANPNSSSYVVNANIEIDATGYAKNFHYLVDQTFTNTTTKIPMYLLNDSAATLTVLRVVDGAQQPIEDAIIEVQSYDIGTGTYNTVSIAETNFNGEDLVYLNWYDTLYQFIIKQDGVTVLQTNPYKISETPQIFEILTTTTNEFTKFEDIEYSLTFNDTTHIFKLIYTKPDAVDSACLRVIKRNVTADTQICLTCNTAASATITCDVTAHGNGTYIAAFYGTGSLKLIDALSAIVDISNQIYDALGNIDATAMAIIFAGVITVIFFVSPVLGIVGVILGMLGALALGLQPMEGEFAFAYYGIIIVGATIAWLIKK